jgi:hypothetical protein
VVSGWGVGTGPGCPLWTGWDSGLQPPEASTGGGEAELWVTSVAGTAGQQGAFLHLLHRMTDPAEASGGSDVCSDTAPAAHHQASLALRAEEVSSAP